MSLVMKRKSIREFKPEGITEEQITTLLKSGMQAPSAHNQQPWEFIVIDDKEILNKMSKMSKGSWPLAQAPLAIVTMMRESDKSPRMIPQDLSAVTQNILLEAVNLGLGAVWIGVFPLEERLEFVSNILDINGSVQPFSIIAVGHPLKEKEMTYRYDENRVHRNGWKK